MFAVALTRAAGSTIIHGALARATAQAAPGPAADTGPIDHLPGSPRQEAREMTSAHYTEPEKSVPIALDVDVVVAGAGGSLSG